jgi:acetyl esterase/lipase
MNATMLFRTVAILLMTLMTSVHAQAPGAAVPLWTDGAPGTKGTTDKDVPQITPWIPKNANGAAIVVAPGGGYGHLAMDHEGKQIAEWCNVNGIAAFVLRYRHAPEYNHPYPHMDAQRAVRTVRARAAEWGVNPDKIGMIGFSAGGHLTATTVTQFDAGNAKASDPIERVSSKLNFGILGYPVITMTDPYTHKGSRKNLLGKAPSAEMITKMSAENNVTADTPPCFFFHTTEDKAVPVQNAIKLYLALVENGVSTELHAYDKGRHGLGLAKDHPGMAAWPGQCITWLKGRGMVE